MRRAALSTAALVASLTFAWLLAEAQSAAEPPAAPAFVDAAHAVPANTPGIEDPQRAWQNWTLNCQGCHRYDGTGSDATAPSIAGTVAKFLWVPGGREYLMRVPGVATAPLSDADLAEVMNWMLWRFDREHIPSSFKPFTATELSPLRSRPLRLEASRMRSDLLAKAEAQGASP